MTTSEIMIGDYFHSKTHNVDSKIIGIESNAVWFEHNSCWERHFIDEIEPIKLTEEIMEKNFDRETGYIVGWSPNGDGTFYVRCECVRETNEIIVIVQNRVRYFHELQHILRLAKCGKEFVL